MIGNAPPMLAFLSGEMLGKTSLGPAPADGTSGFGALMASLASTSALVSADEGSPGLQEFMISEANVAPTGGARADMVLDIAVPVDASGNPIVDELVPEAADKAAPVDQMPTASADGVALATGAKTALPVLSPADRGANADEVPVEEHDAALPIAARIMAMFLRTPATPKGEEVRGPDGEQTEDPLATDDPISPETDEETVAKEGAVIPAVDSPMPASPSLGGAPHVPAAPVASAVEPDHEAHNAPAQPVLPQARPQALPETDLASPPEPKASGTPAADRDVTRPAAVFQISAADSDGAATPEAGTSQDRSTGPALREAHIRHGEARVVHPVDGGIISVPEASAKPALPLAVDDAGITGDVADTPPAPTSAATMPASATVSDAQPISVAVQPAPVSAPSSLPLPSAIPDPAAAAHADIGQMAMERHLDLAHDSDWLDQLARDIVSIGAGNSKLQFKLNPENLGSLHVELIRRDDGATVRMTTDSEAARAMLADAQGRLVAEARVHGVRITETSVDLGRGGGGGEQGQRGLGDPQSGQHNSHSQHRDVNGSVTTNRVNADRTEAPATRHERYA